MQYKKISQGNLRYIKPEGLKIGDVIEGIFVGTNYNETYDQDSYKIQLTTPMTYKDAKSGEVHDLKAGDVAALNETTVLAGAFSQLKEGTPVRVEYLGKGVSKKKGNKPPHLWDIGAADAPAETLALAPAPTGTSGNPF